MTEVKFITDKETFLKMKANQKSIAINGRFNKQIHKTVQRANSAGETIDPRPIYHPLFADARAHNIAYALVRGKKYIQVEQKIGPHPYYPTRLNTISRSEIESVLKLYNIEPSLVDMEGLE